MEKTMEGAAAQRKRGRIGRLATTVVLVATLLGGGYMAGQFLQPERYAMANACLDNGKDGMLVNHCDHDVNVRACVGAINIEANCVVVSLPPSKDVTINVATDNDQLMTTYTCKAPFVPALVVGLNNSFVREHGCLPAS